MIELSKVSLVTIVGFLTGSLGSHAMRLNILSDAFCKRLMEESEGGII